MIKPVARGAHGGPHGSQRTSEKRVTTAELLRQLPQALRLVWQASASNAVVLAALTVVQAALPASLAWVGKLIIDAVVAASKAPSDGSRLLVWRYVSFELGLALVALVVGRLLHVQSELLRISLGNLINERILEKSLTLELKHFEDSETYDAMQNARREASARPLALAMDAVSVARNLLTLSSFAVLLWSLSWWSVLVLLGAALPSFFAETRLSTAAFRIYSWRAPETRRLNYLEWILTRDSHVKESEALRSGPVVARPVPEALAKFMRRIARWPCGGSSSASPWAWCRWRPSTSVTWRCGPGGLGGHLVG